LCGNKVSLVRRLKRLAIRLWYKITGRRVPFGVVISDPMLFRKALFIPNTLMANDIVSVQPLTKNQQSVLEFEYRDKK
jgi:hypothetical protein